ncbi:hypothetical protein JQC91_00280 [Jannaschia sp. Os4]|uniref:hypothetical protein n=1 Tax=Jannaschia sp. Os4 TaxID=2807617 RepID=UPI00193A77FC|nr:hypothetical protein [Jannaschia sp. Os4]MBM2574726.1 hypothetical protein [Jannaschia sp. Os4]
MMRLRGLLTAFAVGVAACAGWADGRPDLNLQPPSAIPADLDPCRHFVPGEPMVRFSILRRLDGGTVPMRVPARYLVRAPLGDGAVVPTALFSGIEIPTFEPLPRRETRRRVRERLTWDWFSFIVTDLRPTAETAGLNMRRNDLEFGDPRRVEELETPVDPLSLPLIPADHGLTQVLPGPDRGRGEDIFVHTDAEGELEGWLKCSYVGLGFTRNAGCQHYFRVSGVDVRASYLRTELPNWRILHDHVTRFLACATNGAA